MADDTYDLECSLKVHKQRPHEIGGFRQAICHVEPCEGTKGHAVEVSGGFGLGHGSLYVQVDDERVLVADSRPVLRALIDEALRLVDGDTEEA